MGSSSIDKGRAMRLHGVLFNIRGLAFVSALTALVLGGSILLLREFAPIRTSAPPGAKTRAVIMEGVDINCNGPGRFFSEPFTGGQRRFPPELRTGVAW
jgi:hypothetical protein